ncbi:hypothetical protein BN2497_11627 [Janthinobacterium sp. CG23_2]|nr:hypothetical protein BN2497_11627 [Janthinobacterium sp. CG23_2]CUU32211.1 hypothetical protein BN3177_11627 [Janthinobacterium sp. CG23_2]
MNLHLESFPSKIPTKEIEQASSSVAALAILLDSIKSEIRSSIMKKLSIYVD